MIVSVDITGLSEGVYDCNMIISDPCAMNSPQTVDVKLRIGGNGPLRSKLEKFCRELGIDDQIIFLGLLSRSKVLYEIHTYKSFGLVDVKKYYPLNIFN